MYNHWFWRSLFFSEMYVLVLHRKTLQISSRKVFFKNFKNQIHFILYVNWNYFSRLRWNVIISLNNSVWDQEVPAIYHLKLDYLSNCSKKKRVFFRWNEEQNCFDSQLPCCHHFQIWKTNLQSFIFSATLLYPLKTSFQGGYRNIGKKLVN